MIPMKPDEPSWSDADEVLHLIAQSHYHAPAYIAGTAEGLTRLRDALNRALDAPRTTQSAQVMCSDGEGYGIFVRCESGGEMDLMPKGYTDREMCPPDEIGRPHWMLAAR